MARDVLEILTSPSYVTLVEGQPGSGKTSLALKACSRIKKCTYISYTEPESSLRKKLSYLTPEFNFSGVKGAKVPFLMLLMTPYGNVF
ncbi:MAG: hypothetical protein ACP5GS_06590 [Nitrososphaeria archaeon]